jgi:FkbM family methyltransferase
MQNNDIINFLGTNNQITDLIKNPSHWKYRKMTLVGFLLGFFSFWECIALMLPVSFSIKRKYLPKQLDFLNHEVRRFISEYASNFNGIDFFGRDFIAPNYITALNFISEVVIADQYHAKDFIKDDSVVIDAGANIGIFSLFASHLAPRGSVYSFEPVKETFDFLSKNSFECKNIFCINSGLGDYCSKKEILNKGAGSVDSVMRDSPFFKKQKYGSNAFTSVDIQTIDSFVSKKNLSKVDFIKIDTEGYESKVLLGAKDTICSFEPVISMSAYHNPDDKELLPKLLSSIHSGYVCNLYHESEEDFVCYVRK